MITPDNYLGFMNIFINEIFGSVILFILIGIVLIAYICTVNSFSTLNTIAILIIFIMVTLTLYFSSLWLGLILLVAGIIIYTGINRMLNKQG